MSRHARREQQREVAVCSTAAAAEFVAATLSVHGVEASTSSGASSGLYPSVDWAAGYRVCVPAASEGRARRILTELEGRDDVVVVGEAG